MPVDQCPISYAAIAVPVYALTSSVRQSHCCTKAQKGVHLSSFSVELHEPRALMTVRFDIDQRAQKHLNSRPMMRVEESLSNHVQIPYDQCYAVYDM